jgi:non-heme chloroperoxidase
MLKTNANPGGLPIEVFDQIRAGVVNDRAQFFKDPTLPFYGYNRPGAKISEGVRESFWLQSMMDGVKAEYDRIKAFCETDFTEDLRKIDIRVLVIHGDDDQIVPYSDSAPLTARLLKRATLKTHAGLPHGMSTTHASRINQDLLEISSGYGGRRRRRQGEGCEGTLIDGPNDGPFPE